MGMANVYTVKFIREVDGDDYERGTAEECVEQLARELQACFDNLEVGPAGSFQITAVETFSWDRLEEVVPPGKVDYSGFVPAP